MKVYTVALIKDGMLRMAAADVRYGDCFDADTMREGIMQAENWTDAECELLAKWLWEGVCEEEGLAILASKGYRVCKFENEVPEV